MALLNGTDRAAGKARSGNGSWRFRVPAWAAAAVILFVALSATTAHCADPEPTREQLIKAAFVYRIAKFVEWPSPFPGPPDAPLTFCVTAEDDTFLAAFNTIKGKTVKGRQIRVKAYEGPGDLSDCCLLFISGKMDQKIASLLSPPPTSTVLTVGDVEYFAEQGGMISLVTSARKIKLAVNVVAVERAGIKISAKLLALARIVKTNDE